MNNKKKLKYFYTLHFDSYDQVLREKFTSISEYKTVLHYF